MVSSVESPGEIKLITLAYQERVNKALKVKPEPTLRNKIFSILYNLSIQIQACTNTAGGQVPSLM